jgi:ribosomal protein S2
MERFKIKVKKDHIEAFENYLRKRKIQYRKYPEVIERTYSVICQLQEIVDAGYCIDSLEDMPKVELQEAAENRIPEECYIEYGKDLDGCSTQSNEGCGRCVLFRGGGASEQIYQAK